MSGRWKAALSALTVLVVLAVCGVGSYLMVLDETQGTGAQAGGGSPQPTAIPVDITTREIDSAPLTVEEVFPGPSIVVDPQKPNEVYTVLRTQALTSCKTATSGEISKLIEELGCSQVIRATMSSPTNGYLITGGIMNLETATDASDAWDRIKFMVNENKGRFIGYAERSDPSTKPLVLAPTHAGWNIRGHFLVYCVIARTDEQEIAAGDPFAKQILYDVIEYYLKGKIIDGRAFDPIGQSPAADAQPSATG
jgi:hypothetical protein